MAGERIDHTLQATALVHEAFIRLVGKDDESEPHRDGRGHFFSAAAEAMRRILIDSARRKPADKRGGGAVHKMWDEFRMGIAAKPDEILAVDEALTKLSEEDPDLAKIVSFRYFAGMTVPETAAALGISTSSVDRQWAMGNCACMALSGDQRFGMLGVDLKKWPASAKDEAGHGFYLSRVRALYGRTTARNRTI